MGKVVKPDDIYRDITSIENRLSALERVDHLPQYYWVAPNRLASPEIAVPNTGVLVTMVQADNVTPTQFQFTTGSTDETWLCEGVVLVRADSANDTPLRAKLYSAEEGSGVDYAASYTSRVYWGASNLQGWQSIYMRGHILVPATTTRSIRLGVQIAGGPFGGSMWGGAGYHTNWSAMRVA